MEIQGLTAEKIGGISLYISQNHRFGTDAFLLADFAAPRHIDSVCDLCSGCGIVAAVMWERFKPKKIETVEIDEEAAALQRLTVQKSGLKAFSVVRMDLKEYKPERELDVITCNPPYKLDGTGLKNKSEAAVNARHEVLCRFEDVCEAAAGALKYGGRLCVCNRPQRLCDMMCQMRACGIEPKRMRLVSKNSDSEPWLVLLEGRKGGSPFLKVERTLFTCNEDGSRSDELKSVYIGDY
ncbi:MAG: methyltransferase [Ruminococcus sp.]|nr:methyltransferase [Ruminococcus sp.]